MSMVMGPTWHKTTEDNRLEYLNGAAVEFRARIQRAVNESTLGFIDQALRDAYRFGIADGFAQGVAASEAERENQ
jgi:hypothetical protein